jgi:hypothetical protein
MRGFILTVVIAAGLFTLITQPHRFVSSSTVTITAAAASPTPEKHAQEGIDPMVTFGNAITSMVRVGAIDKSKFTKLYAGDENLLHNALMLLNEDSKRPVQVNQHNAGLILNMLWPLGISNQSDVLSKGPMGTTFKDRMNNMASTAGWILAVESGERYVNQLMLVPLRPDQQSMVVEISQHIYRPCCNNPTSFPDCNHGAAMLGYIELAVSQNLSPQRIYANALALNSLWFPKHYQLLNIWTRAERNTSLNSSDPKTALGSRYSSAQSASEIALALKKKGVLPTSPAGGNCSA